MIRERYQELLGKEYKFDLIDEVVDLKTQCIKEQNKEYYFLCNLLIIDIYIEHQNFDEALEIAQRDIQNFDSATFRNIYLSYLERLIYIYITKKNFRIAKKYVLEKEKFIDKNNNDLLNRWYLELSYIYGESGELDKAEQYLNKILTNHPSDEIRSYVLCNLTKIYIDLKRSSEAKICLNECLQIIQDQEGKVYCDYLLAKSLILDSRFKEALQIFDQMFQKEDINEMTLSMVNEYLELLIQMKLCEKALLVMNKMGIFMNASNDLITKKAFLVNKINYFVAIQDINPISSLLEEIKNIDEKIIKEEQSTLDEFYEDDKQDSVERSVTNVIEKIDSLTTLVNCSLNNDTLRDLMMDYCNKLQKIIPFDETTFLLFNSIDEEEYLSSEDILCVHYKKERVYEKKLRYDQLHDTVVEMLINKKEPLSLSLTNDDLSLKGVFSGNDAKDDGVKYLSAFPCVHKNDIFAAIIFASYENDLTTQDKIVLLKVASKFLEDKLVSTLLHGNLEEIKDSYNTLKESSNQELTIVNKDYIYLTEELKNVLRYKIGTISKKEYLKKISPMDIDRYQETIENNDQYEIEYRLVIDEKHYPVVEKMKKWQDPNTNEVIFKGTIHLIEEKSLDTVLGEKEFKEKLNLLKKDIKQIEFKFSLIRIRGVSSEFQDLKETFGTDPYYLPDGTFVIFLINEINQVRLENLVKNYVDRCSIIRYPRDIINLDEALKVSKILLEHQNLFFTEDLYKEYLKKVSIANEVKKFYNSKVPLIRTLYYSYDDTLWGELKAYVVGVNERDNARDLLTIDMLKDYDIHVYLESLKIEIKHPTLFPICNNALIELLREGKIKKQSNIYFVLHQNDENLSTIMDVLRDAGMKIFVDSSIIDDVDAYNLSSGLVCGVTISKGIESPMRTKLLKLAGIFDLIIASSYRMNDWKKNIYRSERTEKLN